MSVINDKIWYSDALIIVGLSEIFSSFSLRTIRLSQSPKGLSDIRS